MRKKSIKFVTIINWNYRGTTEEQYEECIITPYKKSLKQYVPYCIVGGAGADGTDIRGYNTLKQAILNGFNIQKYTNFNRHQKKHLRKVLQNLNK
ncbi:MAG: hypothetical protein IJW82_00030 [Clostridia bacterium]|nr:hypothetical protein [Clostridia bacterium]